MAQPLTRRDPMTLVGIGIRTSNENAHEIGSLWGRFMGAGLREKIEGRVDDTIVAAYCEYEGDHTQPYTFFLGCPVEAEAATPEGFTRREVPAGTFAHFPSHGEQPQALMQTWGTIWNADLERAFATDYEVHGDDPSTIDVFVGVDAGR